MVAFSKFSRNALAASVIYYMAHDSNTEKGTNNINAAVQARRFRAKEGSLEVDSTDDDPSTSKAALGSEKAYEIFKTVDIGDIVDVMNGAADEMRANGIGELPNPSFVVLGEQSAGKSRLIEAIAGEKFNFVGGGKTASRRPTRITFKKDAKLTEEKGPLYREWYFVESGKKGPDGNDIKTKMDVDALQERLAAIHSDPAKKVPVAQKGKKRDKEVAIIEKDEIVLECRGAEYDIVITDLPGIMKNNDNVGTDVQSTRNIQTIDELVKSAFQKKENRILLIDGSKEIEHFKAVNTMVEKYYKGQSDYSRVTLVRTKLDRYYEGLKGKSGGNIWLRGEDIIENHRTGETSLVSRFDKAPGIKFASLSCPHETKDLKWGDITTAQFQAFRKECDKTDLKVVAEAQALESKFKDSSVENARVLKTVGFENFAQRLAGDVKEVYLEQVRPVVENLRSKRISLSSQIADAKRNLHTEQGCKDQKETGRLFAKSVGAVLEAPTKDQTSTVATMFRPKEGAPFKGPLTTSSLISDLEEFAGPKGVKSKMIFDPEPSKILKPKEKTPEIGGSPEALRRQDQDQEALKEQQFEKVKLSLQKHLTQSNDPSSPLYKFSNPEYSTSFDKLQALTSEMTHYMNSVEPYFDARNAAVKVGGGSHVNHNKAIVKEIVQDEGMSMLMHHISVIGLRVKGMFEQVASRTRVFMTESLPLNRLNEDINIKLIGSNWVDYTKTPIDKPQVFNCVEQRYKEFLHEIFLQFRDDYKEQLKYMLHDPYALLMGSENPEGYFSISEATAKEELVKRLAQKKQTPADADLAAQQEAADKVKGKFQMPKLQNLTLSNPAGAGAGEAPKSGADDESSKKGAESSKKGNASSIFEDDYDRHIDMEAKITDYFGGDNADKWTAEEAGNTVQKLAGLLFKAARAKIADTLSQQIHRYFYNKLAKNTFHSKKDGALGSFEDFMSILPDKCFVADADAIKAYDDESKLLEKQLNSVDLTLSKFEKLLK